MNLQLTEIEAATLAEYLAGHIDVGSPLPLTAPNVDILYPVLLKLRERHVSGVWCHTCGCYHDIGCMISDWLVYKKENLP